jgi:alpha-galactosidase
MKFFVTTTLLILFGIFGASSHTLAPPDSLAFLKWAPTPVLGWNSWDCFGPTVVESEVKANADYMAANMKKSGWQYIVVDIRWYVENDKAHGYNEKDAIYVMDEYGRLMPSPLRFPSSANGKGFKPLADYIHSKGLKFGIHMMRGIPMEAVKKNTPILGSKAKAADIYSLEGQCPWLKDMYTIVAEKDGAQAYYNSIFKLYASWGLDFVKVDDLSVPYHFKEIEMIRKAIDNCGRPIVLSTSPGETPIQDAKHVESHANMWRIVGDFWDNWPQLKEHFAVCNRWSPFIGTGHFPDADMLPLGRIGIRAERGDNRMCALTKDEQMLMMSLFAIFRSPLMFGGNLPDNDDFTLSLITNPDMLYVNQHSSNNKQLFNHNDLVAWTADDPKTGDKFLALFNASDQAKVYENNAAWKSGFITKNTPNQSVDIDLDIKGAQKLYLVTTDNGEEFQKHNADWIEPVLIGKDTVKLSTLKWEKAPSGRQRPIINKSVNNKALIVNNKEYTTGISTNTSSVIVYTLPEGYNRFKAKAGLDNEAVISGSEGSNVKFMIFTQDPIGPVPADSVKIAVKLEQLGLKGAVTVTDLWSHKRVGNFTNEFAPMIKRHGAGLYRITTKK